MAVGIGLGFIALEGAQLCAATLAATKAIGRWSKPAIVGTLVASAVMNALAFGAQADGLLVLPSGSTRRRNPGADLLPEPRRLRAQRE